MANNELNIHGANLEDLQKTADRCSKPEDLAASQQAHRSRQSRHPLRWERLQQKTESRFLGLRA